MRRITQTIAAIACLAAALLIAGCGGDDSGASGSAGGGSLTIYSGREEDVVAQLYKDFEAATGITLNIRYGGSAELAAQIAEEGGNSPADVFFSQDAGTLGAVDEQLAPLSQAQLERIPAQFRSPDGHWVGTSGRSRVVAYNTNVYKEADLPDKVLDYTDPKFKGRLGIAPTNASFQAFVTVMRLAYGDDKTRSFLEALKANDVKTYEKNLPILEAIASGEIDVGLVNHYYLALLKEEQPDAPVANHFLTPGDPGAFVNVAGVGVLATSKKQELASKFVDYLLSDEGQRYYTTKSEEAEYPLVAGVPVPAGLPPLSDLLGPGVKVTDLGAEERKTLELLTEVGLTS
jgi:iron(III) transport system substrate-binding protein